jgi:hypothetical protein
MACEGVGWHSHPPPFDKDNQDILETEEEDGETLIAEGMADIEISADEDASSSEWLLHLEAEASLREIVHQFRLRAAKIDDGVASFQNCLAVAQGSGFEVDSEEKPVRLGCLARS